MLDPVACDAYGYCAELLPEAISLDEWGYPVVDGRPLPPELVGGGPPSRPRLSSTGHHPAGASGRSLRSRRATMAACPCDRAVHDHRLLIRQAVDGDLPRSSSFSCWLRPRRAFARGRRPRPLPVGPARDRGGSGAVLVAQLGARSSGVCQLIVFRHLQAAAASAPRSSRCTCMPTTAAPASARADRRGSRAGPSSRLLPRPADVQPARPTPTGSTSGSGSCLPTLATRLLLSEVRRPAALDFMCNRVI